MITVNYKLVSSPFFGKEALIVIGIEGSPSGEALFCFDGIKNARLRIGERTVDVKDSMAVIKLDTISDGIISPVAEVGKRMIPASPVIKHSGALSLATADGGIYTALLGLCLSLEKRMAEYEGELKELSAAVKGHSIFNFIEQRKDKK